MKQASPPSAQGLRVAVFGFDVAEASQIRRIRALRALGCHVTSFCQRREGSPDFTPEWQNIDLGLVRHQDIKGRALGLGGAVKRALSQWRVLADAQLIIARNLDLAMIALAARRIAALRAGRAPAPLVYECLDIHDLMTHPGRKGQVMRMAERRVLANASLLVVSSPGFVENYFAPMQGYRGPVALVENKLWLGLDPTAAPARPTMPAPVADDAPITLGLVGSIRCQASAELLFKTLDLMGDRLRLRFSGALHDHALQDFRSELAKRPNAVWTGPYHYPDGLAQAYEGVDLVWAQDMWQRGTNSDWLLPNRIYEASWCGCPQIGLADTQTGRRIAQDGLGFVIPRPDPAELAALLNRLTHSDVRTAKSALLTRPATDFVQSPEELLPVLAPARPARKKTLAGSPQISRGPAS
ncbi:glycosyltransferase [Paracoccus laeviglucosivorans]|uniref:Succinoglycan biosynthesis protein ExoL n=1 Tax=Paracoccus laeviglucosivorans TaxID=1197861 RepID=A0A521F4X0_9RHOB|nr:glycosyltransferase [Paracoccus laeviglucosivorans]SMO91204.1 succinoglycan biosynthesis protein ExoL [Paracoccus laeviglucosivorans]